jgi:hypothetical protein
LPFQVSSGPAQETTHEKGGTLGHLFVPLIVGSNKRLAKFTYLQVHDEGTIMSFARTPLYRIIKVTQHCLHAAIRRSFKVSFKLDEPATFQQGFSDMIHRRTIAKKWRLYARSALMTWFCGLGPIHAAH